MICLICSKKQIVHYNQLYLQIPPAKVYWVIHVQTSLSSLWVTKSSLKCYGMLNLWYETNCSLSAIIPTNPTSKSILSYTCSDICFITSSNKILLKMLWYAEFVVWTNCLLCAIIPTIPICKIILADTCSDICFITLSNEILLKMLWYA